MERNENIMDNNFENFEEHARYATRTYSLRAVEILLSFL
jgi:hypothetical protein